MRTVPANSRGIFTILGTLLVSAAMMGGWWACGEEATVNEDISYEELLDACIASNSCGVQRYPRVGDCVHAYYKLHRAFGIGPSWASIYQCVVQAKGNCDKVFECFGVGRTAGKCDATYKGRCDGLKAVSCDLAATYRVFVIDCAKSDLQCVVKTGADSFSATCGLGSCTTGMKPECLGNVRYACESGVKAPYDCAKVSEVCGLDESGVANCVGNTAESCTNNGPSKYTPSCKGNVALSCKAGKVKQEDCSQNKNNTKCENTQCAPAGTECVSAFDRCQGSDLQACLDGRWVTFNCANLGLGDCAKQLHGDICYPMN